MQLTEQELARNALTSKVHFGGGSRGCLGVVYTAAKYLTETGINWTAPPIQGAYPIFVTNATDKKKKLAISEFIREKHGITVVDAVQELLKNQFIEAIDEDYILKLKQRIQEWNGRTLLSLLTHVFTNYTIMDDLVYNETMKRSAEPPDMDLPISKYFIKQEECPLLTSDSKNAITNAAMVLQITTHMSDTIINISTTKYKHQSKAEKIWAKGKIWFHHNHNLKAIAIVDKAQSSVIGSGYQANMGIMTPSGKEEACDKARDKIAGEIRNYFEKLAQAAVTKSDTINAHTATLAAQAKAIVELMATNAIIVAALTAKGTTAVTPPPGVVPVGTETSNTMGHVVNSAEVACSNKKSRSRTMFVIPQHCTNCGKVDQWHLPKQCLEASQNIVRKAKILTKRVTDKAVKVAQTAANS